MAKSLDKIKGIIKDMVPCSCSVIYKQGRKKVLLKECTLTEAYPEIFVVSLFDESKKRSTKLSFSYIDILTKNVCISPKTPLSKEQGA